MNYKVGDYVTRDSYNNDIIFKIIDINNDIAYLKGVNVRLSADSNLSDLRLTNNIEENDDSFIDDTFNDIDLDRSEYFYLPGSILHID
ncbi:MAG: sporulation peptidase YabG, partial [Bacilli bacterium]|nr:sporulation peptidase YabG [Bacilli bacterium]